MAGRSPFVRVLVLVTIIDILDNTEWLFNQVFKPKPKV